MIGNTKLLLIACSDQETKTLTERIADILRGDYGLGDEVEFLPALSRQEVPSETPKNHRHPLVAGYFPDLEVQTDTGRNTLFDVIRGKHVVLVEHLLTPTRVVEGNQTVSVNDHVMTIRGFLDVLGRTEIAHVTLAAPYFSYVRSHSVERYQKGGFFQFDSLRRTLTDYQRDGLRTIVTIDPHSEKAAQLAEELGMNLHMVNPFQSARAINPYKLGLSGAKARDVRRRLRPFQERFTTLRKEKNGHLYVVAVDDGAERRVENFVERAFPEMDPEEFYGLVLYFGKRRESYTDSKSRLKTFSQMTEGNLDPEGTYIIPDDMVASGGTARKTAQYIKTHGGSNTHVELWTTHAVTMSSQYKAANDSNGINHILCLDSVPQSPNLNIEYIPASADLLASGLYKAHCKLLEEQA